MLHIQQLEQVFHPGEINEVHALRSIDLQIPPGQFVTVIGSNGAGKSTLFNAVAGVYPPTSGRILIDGVDVTNTPEHLRARLIGRVFQDPLMGTAATMTIAQNLTLALLRDKRHGLGIGVSQQRLVQFQELLTPLGLNLEKRLDTRVSMLSGGQRQALTLLMSTMTQPKVLLLDEHTAALDPSTAATILDLTRRIVEEQNLTTLMITHNMQQALETGDRTLMMDSGQVVLDLLAHEKESMTVQDMVEMFTAVRHQELADERLLLG